LELDVGVRQTTGNGRQMACAAKVIFNKVYLFPFSVLPTPKLQESIASINLSFYLITTFGIPVLYRPRAPRKQQTSGLIKHLRIV
jgi:hypothetical protein